MRHVATDTYLTANGKGNLVTFSPRNEENGSQLWRIEPSASSASKYGLYSLADTDSLMLTTAVKLSASAYFPFYIDQAIGSDRVAIHTGASASTHKYWDVAADGSVQTSATTTLTALPFQLIPVGNSDAISDIDNGQLKNSNWTDAVFDLTGRKSQHLRKGIFIKNHKKFFIK